MRNGEVRAAVMRQTAGEHGVGEPPAVGYADAVLVHESTLAAFSDKHLFDCWIVDQAGNHRTLALERNRDGELRNSVQEIGRSIEWVDDPAVRLVGALAAPAFFAEEAVARSRL